MQTKQIKSAIYAALGIGIVLATGTGILAARAQQKGSTMPEPRCKVTPIEAIKIAKGKIPGRALNANFEFDAGKWIYGVVIVSGKTIKEVTINPMTGKVGDIETVTPEDEAKEIKEELTKAIGGKVNSKTEADEKTEKPQYSPLCKATADGQTVPFALQGKRYEHSYRGR